MHIKGKVSKSVNKFVLIDVSYVYVGMLLLKQHILWSFVICDVKTDYLYNRLSIYTTQHVRGNYPLITANYMISATNWPLTQSYLLAHACVPNFFQNRIRTLCNLQIHYNHIVTFYCIMTNGKLICDCYTTQCHRYSKHKTYTCIMTQNLHGRTLWSEHEQGNTLLHW